MKRARFVALLLVSVMLLSVIQPAFAKERTWGEVGKEAGKWGFWSLVGGAVVGGAVVFFSGGTALPVIGTFLGTTVVEGAVTGAITVGATGVVAGAIGEEGRDHVVQEAVEKVAQEVVIQVANLISAGSGESMRTTMPGFLGAKSSTSSATSTTKSAPVSTTTSPSTSSSSWWWPF